MINIFNIISISLYFIVGTISLLMAYKALSSNKLLSFHEQATGRWWNEIDRRLQHVMLALLKISGLGFLAVALLLLTFPIANYFYKNIFITISVPIIAITFCFGLFLFNYSLYKKTNANTPWKRSLIIIVVLIVSFILSVIP